MRIAIVVQGRFYAFDLAASLTKRGHDVHVFTNYPKWAAKRFGLSPDCVHGFWQHGALCRAADRLGLSAIADAPLHRMFGRWAAKRIASGPFDVIHVFSGVAEEPLGVKNGALRLLVRGSAHIRTQDRILAEESARVGAKLERPSGWKIAREEREYLMADRIVVLSRFARQSFVAQGVEPWKLALLPLGAETRAFRPSQEILDSRCRRILSRQPLLVLFTGLLNFRKGLYDFAKITRELHQSGRFRFRVIGTVTKEAREIAAKLPPSVEFVSRQAEADLPKFYAEGDLFLFPTLEDGYAAVLAQASANCLPLLASTNCAGPDVVMEGETGWVLPIRDPAAYIERLLWCDRNREELAQMVHRIHADCHTRNWDDVAATFEDICAETGVKAK
jgi:glycosyltransferase involved in cell wall biosynthesis